MFKVISISCFRFPRSARRSNLPRSTHFLELARHLGQRARITVAAGGYYEQVLFVLPTKRSLESRRGQQQLWLGEAFRPGGVRGSVAAFSTSLAPEKDKRQTPEKWHRLSAPACAAVICSRKVALDQPTSQTRQKNAFASSPSSAAEESRAGKSIELPALPCFRLDGQHQPMLSLVRAPRRLDSNVAVNVRAS